MRTSALVLVFLSAACKGAPPAKSTSNPISPAASVEPAPNTPDDSDAGPVIDCDKLASDPAPSRRWLCELAMGKGQNALLDANGFALVTEYESPGDDGADRGHMKKRVCGVEAEKWLKDLARSIRYTFALEENDPGTMHVECTAKSCSLFGMGEYSTNTTLTFRNASGRPILDSWAEIEVVLVDDAEVQRRERAIDAGLKELANAKCGP